MTTHATRTVRGAELLDAVHALPGVIESVSTRQLSLEPRPDFDRITTLLTLSGGGHSGTGEAIHYSPQTQHALPAWFASIADDLLLGSSTLGELSARLDSAEFPPINADGMATDKPGFERWAIESAALDLALQTAGLDLAQLVQASWQPVRTTPSMGLGEPPTSDIVRAWRKQLPGTEFKLDMNRTWTRELVEDLASTRSIATVDFKGLYGEVSFTDTTPDPPLFRMIADGLPDTLLEDMNLTDDVRAALDETAFERLAWDYPISAASDVPGVDGSRATFSDRRPGAINIKPSRFGSLRHLLETIDLCQREQIVMYAGGQFELGRGRTQVQEIASLCFADGPNDCAPSMWHGAQPGDQVPGSPLHISEHVGFGFDAPTPASPREA